MSSRRTAGSTEDQCQPGRIVHEMQCGMPACAVEPVLQRLEPDHAQKNWWSWRLLKERLEAAPVLDLRFSQVHLYPHLYPRFHVAGLILRRLIISRAPTKGGHCRLPVPGAQVGIEKSNAHHTEKCSRSGVDIHALPNPNGFAARLKPCGCGTALLFRFDFQDRR